MDKLKKEYDMWLRISICVVGPLCFLGACDKSDSSSANSAPAPIRIHLMEKHPTTEQLEKSPRKSLSLRNTPISLMVPDGWVVKPGGETADGTTTSVLYGPTPGDDITFQIGASRQLTDLEEKRLETLANQTQPDNRKLLGDSAVRQIPGGKIIEQLMVNSPVPTTQSAGAAVASPATQPSTVEWSYIVLIGGPGGFTAHDLTASLPMKQYMIDRTFVQSIMGTLKLN